MLQKALELCGEVRALGAALLCAYEKRDAQALSLLRSTHEIELLIAVTKIREMQILESKQTLEGLKNSRVIVEARVDFYSRLIQGGQKPGEREQVRNLQAAVVLQSVEASLHYLSAGLYLIPSIKFGAPTTAGSSTGGPNWASSVQSFVGVLGTTASATMTQGTMAVTRAGYDRREEEWKHQLDIAAKELNQIDKQVAAATIRETIAEQELQNHELRIANARAIDEFMRTKFTNRELYDWMVAQTSAL